MKLITKKRLFFDLETSFCVGWFWRTGQQFISNNQIIEHSKIISAHWSWEGEDEVHHAHWGINKQCDKRVLKELIKQLNFADEVITHNGIKFDLKWLRARALYHDLEMHPYYKMIDTYTLVKKLVKLPSYSLGNVCKYYGLEAKKDAGGFDTWYKVQIEKDREALDHLLYYGDGDILSLKALYYKLQPHIESSTHFGVKSGGDKYSCTECGNTHIYHNKMYVTKSGTVQHYMKCADKSCAKMFKISNKSYMDWIKYNRHQK
jgi:hypothetical protein